MENYIRQYCRKILTEAIVNKNDFKKKFFPEMDENIFDAIMSIDPTANIPNNKVGKFALYIAKQIKDGILRNNYIDHTMAEKYKRIFTEILKLRQAKMLPSDFDVNKFNIYELVDYIEELDFTSNRQKEKINKNNVKMVYQDDTCLILIPLTKEAAQFYGKGTTWCTSGLENNMFDRYNSKGPLYICISQSSYYNEYEDKEYQHKFQFQFQKNEVCELKDEKDEDVTLDFVIDYLSTSAIDAMFKLNPFCYVTTDYGKIMIGEGGEWDFDNAFKYEISKCDEDKIGLVEMGDKNIFLLHKDGSLEPLSTETCDEFYDWTYVDDKTYIIIGYDWDMDTEVKYKIDLTTGNISSYESAYTKSLLGYDYIPCKYITRDKDMPIKDESSNDIIRVMKSGENLGEHYVDLKEYKDFIHNGFKILGDINNPNLHYIFGENITPQDFKTPLVKMEIKNQGNKKYILGRYKDGTNAVFYNGTVKTDKELQGKLDFKESIIRREVKNILKEYKHRRLI